MINFICKKISDQMEPGQPAFTIPASLIAFIAHFHKIPMEVGHSALGLHIFGNLTEEKINMASLNMSKRGPIFCVNS